MEGTPADVRQLDVVVRMIEATGLHMVYHQSKREGPASWYGA